MDLTFEIAILSAPVSEADKGSMILARANHFLGVGIARNRGDKAAGEALSTIASSDCDATAFDESKEDHLAWALGRHHRWLSSLRYHLNLNRDAVRNVRRAEMGTSSKSPLVRVPYQFAAEAFGWGGEHGMTMREFRVLVAVYSAIGSDDARILYREQLLLRASGFWNEEQPKRLAKASGLDPLTTDQLRWTLDELKGRRLFVRLSGPSKRHIFYSRNLSYEKLAEHILKRSRPPRSEDELKARDAILKGRHDNSPELPTNPQKVPRKSPQLSPEQSPQSPQNVPASMVASNGGFQWSALNGGGQCAVGAKAPTG